MKFSAKFQPRRRRGGYVTPKTEKFAQFRNIKAPPGAYPLRDFTKFSVFMGSIGLVVV